MGFVIVSVSIAADFVNCTGGATSECLVRVLVRDLLTTVVHVPLSLFDITVELGTFVHLVYA